MSVLLGVKSIEKYDTGRKKYKFVIPFLIACTAEFNYHVCVGKEVEIYLWERKEFLVPFLMFSKMRVTSQEFAGKYKNLKIPWTR